ncbi:MAG: non-homologous end-joining DNA ligase [Bacillota bacterium]
MPRLSPMLAGTARTPFSDDDWLFEVKWDGYRCLAYLKADQVYLDSRNGKPLLPHFPSLSSMPGALRRDEVLLDGEIVAVKAGKVDFSYLRKGPSSVVFVAFDLLWADGESLLEVPLHERKDALSRSMEWGGPVLLSSAVDSEGEALFRWAKEQDMEGIMAKRRDSLYFPGERTQDWLKVKNLHESTFWVVGYLPSPGRRLGSLVVAEKIPEGFRLVGRVSSGLNRDYEERLLHVLCPLAREDPLARAFAGASPLPTKAETRRVTWVEPFFGVQVDYTEMTPDGHLRHPVFRDLAVNCAVAGETTAGKAATGKTTVGRAAAGEMGTKEAAEDAK